MSEQEFNIIFAKNLREQMKKSGMTQLELSERMGVGPTSVYNWCNGVKTPRMKRIDAMCELFQCKRSDLMQETGAPENGAGEAVPEEESDEENNIEEILEQTRTRLMTQPGLMFDGHPASVETVESILTAMQVGMEIARKKNREKYTAGHSQRN